VTVSLSDMSRDALLRELRVAQSFQNLKRIEQVKYWLAKKNQARNIEPEHQPVAPIRGYVDD
jgi:hypothetical protein